MKLKIFFTLLFVLAFFVFSSEKTYAQTCAGQGDPNWCTTGDKWSGTVSRCEYACRYDGYTCTPRCDNVRHYSSCENSETVRCEPVVIGCPRCGNSTDNCFIKRPITPVQPPNCAGACDSSRGCFKYTTIGAQCKATNGPKNGQIVNNNTCEPDDSCRPPPPPDCSGACDMARGCFLYTSPSGSSCKATTGPKNGQVVNSGLCEPDDSCRPTARPGECIENVCATCTPGTQNCSNGFCKKYTGGTNGFCLKNGTTFEINRCYETTAVCQQAPPATATPITPPPVNNTATPVPTATPAVCVPGQTRCDLQSCSGNVGQCSPRCGGGWCSGEVCQTCSYTPSGPPICVKGNPCEPAEAGNVPTPDAQGNRCYSITYSNGVGQCCQPANYVRGQKWEIRSCGQNTPTPKPSYVIVEGVNTPTPRPTGTGSAAKPAQVWKCLAAEPYEGPEVINGKTDHKVKLYGANFPNNKNIFIVGCALINNNFQCTTGDPALDNTLLIKKAAEHEFGVSEGPIKTTTNNKLENIIARSNTPTSTTYTFFGVYSLGPAGSENDQSGNSLQLGSFDTATKQASYKCTGVRWDPYGRIFDNQNLEPVPDIKLELLNESKQLVRLPGLINPAFTDKAGGFNFLVEEGTYYLNPIDLKNYIVVEPQNVNPDAKKAYTNFYKLGDPIHEKAGQPEHRDIAVHSGKGGKTYKPTSLEFTVLPVSGTKQTRLVGQVSHPLTIVSFRQNDKEIGKTVANKFGYYELLVNNNQIQPGVKIIPAFKKVALTTPKPPQNQTVFEKIGSFFNSIFKPTSAAPEPASGAAVDPIPSYLEGYVYGTLGRKMPNAKIELILKMSNQTIYETRTNAEGLLIIESRYMPLFPSFLRITPEGSQESYEVLLSQFLQQNTAYLQKNNINLMSDER